jgi:hypothetical protein
MNKIGYASFLAKLEGKQPEMPSAPAERTVSAERAHQDVHPELEKTALASKLETVSERAIEKLDEILALPLDPEHDQFAGLLRAQNAAANTALNTQIRVDEFQLRHRQTDVLPRLLEIMAREEAKLPKLPAENRDGGDDGP